MRLQILRGKRVSCPQDDIPLKVHDVTSLGSIGKAFIVICPACGFQANLPGPSR